MLEEREEELDLERALDRWFVGLGSRLLGEIPLSFFFKKKNRLEIRKIH